MHIPDGYLGPQTYIALYAAAAPFWLTAARKAKESLKAKQIPMLALGGVFAFVIMMFNIPAPGGSSGHAVGGALLGITLGPWSAMLAVSAAIVVQAVLFGDGGITAIGANCFNMAVLMPFAGYWTYRIVSFRTDAPVSRKTFAAGVAGYVALNISALVTAVEFGIQPIIARGADGAPLYCPYPLSVAVPAMMAEHLLIFGFVEAAATGLVVGYLLKADPSLIYDHKTANGSAGNKTSRFLWAGAALLAILTPLGLLATGTAWGEWATGEIAARLGFVPPGMNRAEGLWKAAAPDYTFPGLESGAWSIAAYIASAFTGAAIAAMLLFALAKLLSNARSGRDSARTAPPPEGWPEQTGGPSERFSEKALRSVVSFIRSAIFSQEYARLDGFMQRLDARAKLASTIIIIVAISMLRSPWHLAALCAVPLALAASSKIPLKIFIKHVWLVVPLFTASIALPALILVPGDPITETASIGNWSFAVTRQGAESAIIFVLRVGASVSFMELLALTTGWNKLMKAFGALKVPPFFVMLIGVTYRYIFHFLLYIEELHHGRKSRALGAADSASGRKWVAGRMGVTLSRSMRMGDEVYEAMASRGFTGEIKSRVEERAGAMDALWLAAAIAALICLYATGGFR